MSWSELLMPNYGTPSVTFVKGSGTELFDKDGKRYLDFLCGIAVTGLGHSHPRIADAISEQANTLLHVSNLFITEPQLEVAETLNRLISAGSNQSGKILFQNSGYIPDQKVDFRQTDMAAGSHHQTCIPGTQNHKSW